MTTEEIEKIIFKVIKKQIGVDLGQLHHENFSDVLKIDLEEIDFEQAVLEIENDYKKDANKILETLEDMLETLEMLQMSDKTTFCMSYEPKFSKEFPFFGAGNASYFEYFGLTIRFQNEPSENLKNEILELLPEDYGASLEDFDKKMLNLYMQYGYEGMSVLYDDGFESFNSAIEEALMQIHEIAPIQFAYRSEDYESEGTAFSEWHTYSGDELLEPTIKTIEKEWASLDEVEVEALQEYLKEIYSLYDKPYEALFVKE